VVVVGTSADRGETVAQSIRDDGGDAVFVQADVSQPEEARKMVEHAVETYGRLDILFNNAGILGTRGVYTADFDNGVAERLMSVNFMGVYYGTRYALPALIKSGGGSIITTGSDSAILGNRGYAVYSATKGAVLAFSRVVAMEYADRGIRANTISPGAGRTPMHAELFEVQKDVWKQVEAAIPMGRAAYPDDVAKAALFFASDDSKYITGANLMVDGGWSIHGL
jgi:NAD(P)-dependent dehydrogenase (short-subunit alcohol dehydrogenase family)